MKNFKMALPASLIAISMLTLSGCSDAETEKAESKAESAMQEAEDKTENAMQETKEKAQEAKSYTEQKAETRVNMLMMLSSPLKSKQLYSKTTI